MIFGQKSSEQSAHFSPSRQRGACKNCGACCYLMFNGCLFLNKAENGKQYCGVYPFRPLNCRKYPRIEKEWVPVKTCGFYFDRSTCEPGTTTPWSPENS